MKQAEALDTTTRADELRGVPVNTPAARRTTTAQLIERCDIREECADQQRGRSSRSTASRECSRTAGANSSGPVRPSKEAQDRGENPKPVKARRQARTALEWLHLPFDEVRSTHLTAFSEGSTQTSEAGDVVNREMDLLSAVIHKAIDSWDLRDRQESDEGRQTPDLRQRA